MAYGTPSRWAASVLILAVDGLENEFDKGMLLSRTGSPCHGQRWLQPLSARR